MNNLYSLDEYRYYKVIINCEPIIGAYEKGKQRKKLKEQRDAYYFRNKHNQRVKEEAKNKE